MPGSNFSSVLCIIGWDSCLFSLILNVLCWLWSEDLVLSRLWHWLDLTGSSREEHSWREEKSIKQVSSNLTSLHAIFLFRWLFVTVNYLAFLLQCHYKIKKRGFDANCCSSVLYSWQPEGHKALIFHRGYSNELHKRKQGQCTMTSWKELKQHDVIFLLV